VFAILAADQQSTFDFFEQQHGSVDEIGTTETTDPFSQGNYGGDEGEFNDATAGVWDDEDDINNNNENYEENLEPGDDSTGGTEFEEPGDGYDYGCGYGSDYQNSQPHPYDEAFREKEDPQEVEQDTGGDPGDNNNDNNNDDITKKTVDSATPDGESNDNNSINTTGTATGATDTTEVAAEAEEFRAKRRKLMEDFNDNLKQLEKEEEVARKATGKS